jgi:hypothetical protein
MDEKSSLKCEICNRQFRTATELASHDFLEHQLKLPPTGVA